MINQLNKRIDFMIYRRAVEIVVLKFYSRNLRAVYTKKFPRFKNVHSKLRSRSKDDTRNIQNLTYECVTRLKVGDISQHRHKVRTEQSTLKYREREYVRHSIFLLINNNARTRAKKVLIITRSPTLPT